MSSLPNDSHSCLDGGARLFPFGRVATRVSHQTLITVLWACTLAPLLGCTTWNASTPVVHNWLRSPKMAADGALFEIVILDVPANHEDTLTEFWNDIDEQAVPADTRRRLYAAGIRCGLLGCQIPDWVHRQFQCKLNVTLDQEGEAAVVHEAPHQRRLQCRAGHLQHIVVRPKCKELTFRQGSRSSPEGETFRDATCELAFKAYPLGDGRVRIEFVSEVRHGSPRQRWVGEEGLFRIDSQTERQTFSETAFDITLTSGQTLAVSAIPQAQSVGQVFFAADERRGWNAKVVLLRLALTQTDDIYYPKQASPPIVTPTP